MKRKLKQIKKVSVLMFIVLFAISCTDDLNITPNDDDTLLSEDAFDDPDAYKSVLAGVYGNLALTGTEGAGSSNISGLDAGTSQFGRVLLYLQTLSADQMIWSYENDPGTRELQRNIWTAQNPVILGMFSRTMATVSFANNFLRETTDEVLASRGVSPATQDEIQVYRAEARFLRALSYYYMMDLFGQAPFGTETNPINSVLPVYNRVQLFEFVESELLAIENDLLDAGPNTEHARANAGAAYMVLAKLYLNHKVYLDQEDVTKYTNCLNYCQKILDAGYSLADSYLHNFMADNNTNSATNEIIFPIVSDGFTTQNFGPTTVMINGSVGSIETNGIEVGVTEGGWGGALRVRKEFAELFADGEFAEDERNTIISDGRPITITDISDRDTGFIIQKYSNRNSDGTPGIDQTFVDTDFPLFRLADVYLMYAEAHLRGNVGDAATALDLLNELRSRSNNPNIVQAADLNLDFILDERSRELHWEAHRRQDLIRFERYTGGNYNWAWKGNGSNGIAIPGHFDIYPIPSLSLSSNPNLTQNSGY